MLRLAKEPPLPRDRYSDEDEDEFEGDDGDSWFWEEAAQNVEKRPLKPVTTAVDQNMLKAPSMFRNSNRCELKASDWGGTGFGFEHSWRNENTRPLVVRAGFLRAVHGSGFKCGVFKSKKTSSNCVISKKTSKPLRHELKPWERERASVLKAYDALMAAAEESATPEVVQIKYQLAEKKSIAYRLFGLTENVHPSPVRELWQKDDTGAAMQEKIVEILEAADPDSLSFEQRLLMFPETIEALKRKTLLQMKPPLSPKEKTELPPLPDVTPLGGSRGIINIHIGQAGCQIGSACWELFCLDHEIGIDGYPDPEAHGGDHDPRYLFDERKNGKWRPRAVFVDMDPTVVGNSQEVSRINNVVLKENNVIGKQECGDNYADGYYSNKPMQAVAIDRMRKLFEACDVSLGVQITHSLGGGCGSGFGSAILHDLKEYTRRPIHCYTVMPSPKVSNGVTELYNWVLAVPDINEVASMCAMYDNESLYFATLMNMGMKDPKFTDMNRIIAQSLSSVTATIRLSSRMSLRSMEHVGTNLCPFPRTNFMTTAFAPLFSATKCAFPKSSFKALATMASAVLHPSGSLVSVDQRKGKAIATSLNFRGDVEPSDALAVLTAYRQNRDIVRVDYTPCDIKSTICSKLPIVAKGSAMQKTTRNISLLMNTTATGGMMQTSFKRANQLFCKRAFVHWYCRVGMEEGEFSEKFEGVAALIRSYEELGKEPEYEEEEEDYY